MTKDEAQHVVIGSLTLAALIAIAADLTRGRIPHPKIMLGAVIAAVLLTAATELDPRPPAYLAATVLLGTAVVVGPDAFRGIGRATRTSTDTTASPGGGGGIQSHQ